MTTSLIIPCYFIDQTFVDMTKACLGSLRYGRPDEVIIVDDGSPITPSFEDCDQQVFLKTNLGYSQAINAGLKLATGDIIIIANNDIIFTPGWLEAIVKPLDEGYDISSICTSDNGYDTRELITEGDKYGSIFAMKRQVYETIGGFDEQFRGYFSDLDHRRRALNAGFKVAKNHAGLVEHEAKSTYKLTDPHDTEFNQARELYIEKWGVNLGDDLFDKVIKVE